MPLDHRFIQFTTQKCNIIAKMSGTHAIMLAIMPTETEYRVPELSQHIKTVWSQLIELRRKNLEQPNSELDREHIGVALSGGGVRSASFCAGVLAGLHHQGQLTKVDILSSVSGGGYVPLSVMANTGETSLGRESPDVMLAKNGLHLAIQNGIEKFNLSKSKTLIKSAVGAVEGLFTLISVTLLSGAFINNVFGTLGGSDVIGFSSIIGAVILALIFLIRILKKFNKISILRARDVQKIFLTSFLALMVISVANLIHSLDVTWQFSIILLMVAAIFLTSQQTNPSRRWVLYMVRGAMTAILNNYHKMVASGLGIIISIVIVLDVFDATLRPYIDQYSAAYRCALFGMAAWITFWASQKSNKRSLFYSYQHYLKKLMSYPIRANGTFKERNTFTTWFPICVANFSILQNGVYKHAAISPVGIDVPNAGSYKWESIVGDELHTYWGAMTLSGAAIDVGITKSRVFRYLLTTFGVNTGLWLRAHKDTLSTDGPRRIHDLMLSFDDELSTSETFYTRASDGGHFENTGIYYLLRLKTKIIFSFDASFDPLETGESLRVLISKARLDLNTDIRLEEEVNGVQIFEIAYPDQQIGKLFYVKHSRVSLPAKNWSKDVSSDFPNDSTANQFLSPDLFDSYYELGLYAARNVEDFFS